MQEKKIALKNVEKDHANVILAYRIQQYINIYSNTKWDHATDM
jgi:hypothetical protein